jgi:transcription antitermination factor NusG
MAEALRSVQFIDADTERRWYACWTRSRHEKRVHQMLEERGIESFLPLVQREQQWRDRRKVVEFPLFPSYVFSRFVLSESSRVLTIPGVAGLVKTNGRPAPILEEELENVRRFAEMLRNGGIDPEPCPFFAEGEEVEVMEGPFAGLRGVVTKHRGRRRVVVGLRAIGQGMVLDIEARLLKSKGQES